MEQPVLADKDVFPTEAIIHLLLGKSAPWWQTFFERVRIDHPGISEEWRYYNDGKRWLLKVCKKAKTVCWITVKNGSFSTTCYFGDKAEEAIFSSSLSDELKDQFRNGKRYGKIRAITIEIQGKRDVESAQKLVALKSGMK